jgi:Ca-activated chloride channel family protein
VFHDLFSFRVYLANTPDLGTPYSPTHQITTHRVGNRLEVTLDPESTGDVELFIPLRRGLVGTSLVTNAPGGEDGFYMLLLAPPQADSGESVPRDLSLVIDVSGSMSGDKIEQAKAAIDQALGSLRPSDRFRLIAFSSAVRNFREGFVSASPANLGAARQFTENLTANGGTNIAGALDAVLDQAPSDQRLPLIIFLTDGIPSVGEQAPDKIAERAASRIGHNRIFTFGVGHDVNTYLLDRLANEGRGSAEYVAPDANVEVAVGSLVSKIQHPALVNLRIVESPVRLVQSYPQDLPDLFYGEELVVFGRYHGQGDGTIVIEGERNGRRERFTTEATFPATQDDNDFIPKLWASRRIGELTRQIRLEGPSESLIAQVRELGLKYGILTEYTSYLVQEPSVAQRPMLTPSNEASARGGRADTYIGSNQTSPSPSAQTGGAAFANADASAKMSSAGSVAEANRVTERRMRELDEESSAGSVKRVGIKVFRLQQGVWIDLNHVDSMTTVDVRPFSPAYFDLARVLPELDQYLSVGDQIIIAGKRCSIRITPTGASTWAQGQLARAVRLYRGQ